MLNNTDYPLILTLDLNESAQIFFNDLRNLHFPAERNHLKAHLTLFHHLPAYEKSILTDIKDITFNQPRLFLEVKSVVSIGNGVAYRILCDELMHLHVYLQQKWQQWLIPQDKQKLWPHITVQNKVDPQKAKHLQQQLNTDFKPFVIYGTGLTLWEYRGGP